MLLPTLLALSTALSASAADAPPPVTLEVTQSSAPAVAQEAPAEKPPVRIIEVYQDGGSTKFILESRTPLVTGRSVYAGAREEALTIGDQMSKKEGLYYYAASAPGKLSVRVGDDIRFERSTTSSLPKAIIDAMRPGSGFEQKSVAEVTAVQSDRILIDKGTLHEVHERDLYRILYGQRLEKSQILFAADKSYGGGVLWNISFYNG